MATTANDFIQAYLADERLGAIGGFFRNNKLAKANAKGLTGSFTSLAACASFQHSERPHLFILPDKEEAAYFLNDMERIIGEKDVLFYPGSYRRPYQVEETDNANVLLRAEVLNRINSRKKPAVIVSYPDALFEQVITRKQLNSNTFTVRESDNLSIDFLNETLFEYHFERVDFVVEPGQFSVRGGIVDVFSFAHDQPYRIEFFGDEVESIRTFDIESQLSIDKVKKLNLIPNVENKVMLEMRQSFFDYISDHTVVWVKSIPLAAKKLDDLFKKAEESFDSLTGEIRQSRPEELFISGEMLKDTLQSFATLEWDNDVFYPTDHTFEFSAKPQPSFNKKFELLVEEFKANTEKGWQNFLLCANTKQVERFYAIFEDIGHEVDFQPIVYTLHEGFSDPTGQKVVYTDHQIFERYQRFKLKTGYEKKQALTLKELTSLQIGDYVTHIDHGIGEFGGLQKIDVNGRSQEAIKLVYNGGDVLYISIHSLHKIARYNGKEGTVPTTHKLGSGAWQKTKAKAKKRVKEVAFDLIKLYAQRKANQGFSFSPDTYLQHELEASFLYEDTPDQITATADVKADMENPVPMDRLICGDVGFGKTEIAIRAAFKAVADSKQVAVLVPTTILAFQHFKTFSERLKDLPCNIDYINRFRSRKQQTEILKKLEEGKLDIVIGTHRLVGKDVKFKDLGLLIIDEEQKFGVSVKDKLKNIKVNVDTLTLTATPIPRTLQFSLMQARDLSVMTTPPPNRHPIETQVVPFSEEMIRDAIMYEMSRGGQVFFIHNRVENIKEVAGMIGRLVPDAKIGIGHGQMEGKKLEELMLNFIDGHFDVLVATSIIENGLDVPNANTIIINNAHHVGLSDLHQMRGRVGRSNKKAFCKLIAPPMSTLTEEARKRLTAIEQFSDLGSGFQIAMRDLEIRGAGDLLGADQSGFMADIGFDTYQKILAEAIEELKAGEFKELYAEDQQKKDFVDETLLDTDLEILIPDTYVNKVEERLRLYQTLDSLDNPEQLYEFEQELIDRFGPAPEEVYELLNSVRLRWMGKEIGFEKIVLKQERLIGYFVSDPDSPFYQSDKFQRVLYFLKDQPKAQMKERNKKLYLSFSEVKTVNEAIKLLEPVLKKEVVF
ncbi:MAG: transcription-repair coupling factor [Owenweeksia sp.]|nr:transcription-repair coupling factor [Owenweeksia sp.]MBF99111.1 transcription-repair coupling factor [Owenweeksia sp.]HBF20821.1 transcription-repair coupling factor [Cryomorphaceae bacterium]|tara:strand:+ start:16659 stop:20006 length:3348 start_codon:yes stop_codon:yes gene_type:complete